MITAGRLVAVTLLITFCWELIVTWTAAVREWQLGML